MIYYTAVDFVLNIIFFLAEYNYNAWQFFASLCLVSLDNISVYFVKRVWDFSMRQSRCILKQKFIFPRRSGKDRGAGDGKQENPGHVWLLVRTHNITVIFLRESCTPAPPPTPTPTPRLSPHARSIPFHRPPFARCSFSHRPIGIYLFFVWLIVFGRTYWLWLGCLPIDWLLLGGGWFGHRSIPFSFLFCPKDRKRKGGLCFVGQDFVIVIIYIYTKYITGSSKTSESCAQGINIFRRTTAVS